MSKSTYSRGRLVLGDQLNRDHSWFSRVDDSVVYIIAELHPEVSYVAHHIQKVCAFFAGMKAFTAELREQGHQVMYLTLDETASFLNLSDFVTHYVRQIGASRFEYQRPDEYRLLQSLEQVVIDGIEIVQVDSEHFLLPYADIADFFPRGKHIIMEHFYRKMRKRYSILVEGDKPIGGRWNFDASNRHKLKAADLDDIPEPLLFATDVNDTLEALQRHNIKTIGTLSGPLVWPINRNQSLNLLAHFCHVCLPKFGRFQDAMTQGHKAKWSLYHSRLSFSLNTKMLSPIEVIETALSAFTSNTDIDLAQIEGFIRQILGWREYIRGVYWANMPEYRDRNHFSAQRNLPDFFWSGATKMSCMREAIGQSLSHGYAHHIQRLMVTGNFCLLSDIDPKQVEAWYLGIYVDAIEWVEMPNTRGMALFADGGIVGTKPYAASGAYINRMSDYCKGCYYDHKQKVGERACPLNSLYWRFMHTHREMLSRNPRIGVIYRSWDNLDEPTQESILATANDYLERIEQL